MLDRGTTLAGYRIDGVLGQGGMGIVYEATQLSLSRVVALKVLAPHLGDDEAFRERFRREGEIQAGIDHPNIVTVYEAGQTEQGFFLAMRLVRGGNLKDLIVAGGLNSARTLRLLSPIAEALDTAHEAGLIHRDIKPQNILVDTRDHPYLADFGLTKATAEDHSLTRTGQFVGTFEYISPEQIRGDPAGSESDVYALAAVLYQCLTGVAPYHKASEAAVLYAHMADPPPRVTDERPDLPPALDEVFLMGMAKEPGDRHPSATALIRDAERAFGGSTAKAPDAPPSSVIGEPPGFAAPGPPQPPAAPAGAAPRGRRRVPRLRRMARDQLFEPAGQSRHPAVRIPLTPAFTLLHGPLGQDEPLPLLGNEHVIEDVMHRIAHSKSGSFLVTGFRGVGKTTVVQRALEGVRERGDDVTLVPVFIDFAQPKTRGELLVEVIRRLYEQLDDARELPKLRPELELKLKRAYERTSMVLRESHSEGIERNMGASLGSSLSIVSPGVTAGRRTTGTSSTDAEYLDYKPTDVEHDFRRIVHDMVSAPAADAASESPGLLARILHSRQGGVRPWKGHVVVVIDELDKLADRAQQGMIRDLIAGLKTMLTTPGVHFLFIGGPDLHGEAVEERGRGNSIYDSVFSWHVYVPCIWGAEKRLLDALIPDEEERQSEQVELLRRHVAFWGRGVPRLMLREINSFVTWDDDQPYLALEPKDVQRVEFFAGLERVVRDFIKGHVDSDEAHIDLDQWRLAVYYAVEWILRFRVTFTAEDVTSLGSGGKVDRLLALTSDEVDDLLEHLEESKLLRQVTGNLVGQTYYGDEPEAQVAAYEVVDDVEAAVRGSRRTAVDSEAVADLEAAFEGHVGEALADGRYKLLDEIDRAGTGRVYRAHDSEADIDVAIKVFDLPALSENERMRERFLREGRIALELDHANIVKTFDTFTEADGRLAIVMEFVEGYSIAHRMQTEGALDGPDAVSIACDVLRALDHIQSKGIVRLDLRPSSVMLDSRLSPVIVNLGLAKHIGADEPAGPTRVGAVLGTPRYAAPEALSGDEVDIRADLYSLALILFEMIAGQPARNGNSIEALIAAALDERIDPRTLPVSPSLAEALSGALTPEPSLRLPDPATMLGHLMATPEGRQASSAPGRS